MFVCEHYEIVPDLLVIGKGLGGGVFPLAALLARDTREEPLAPTVEALAEALEAG